ncbi:MAG: hypothetical protein AAGA56_26315 [Myxococcota bacterium]
MAPLYEDAEAWGQYHEAMAAAGGAARVMASTGLCLGDLARLARHYTLDHNR